MLHSLSDQIMQEQMKKGKSPKAAESSAWAIASAALQRNGYLKKGTNKLTKKGQNYKKDK